MRSAPAVYFLVARSRWHLGLLLVLTVWTWAVVVCWLADVDFWRWLAEISVVLLTNALAWRSWQTAPRGLLRWDGQQWHWRGRNPGRVTVQLDLQSVLLLRWQAQTGDLLWLWLEQRMAPAHWQALRCAVFARPVSLALPSDQVV